MKVLILTEIDDKHILKEANELYDRMQGRGCKLVKMPQKEYEFTTIDGEQVHDVYFAGWNACIEEIENG